MDYTSIGGVVSFPAVGTYVYKHGAYGGVAYCQVSEVSAAVSSDLGIYLQEMTRARLISGSSVSGDSGSPIRTGSSFCGIHHGYDQFNGEIIFTPYWIIRSSGFQTAVG